MSTLFSVAGCLPGCNVWKHTGSHIIIIIIFISFIYGIHSYVPRQTMSLEDTLLQLLFRFMVNMLYGAYLPRSYVGSDGLLRQHFPENVCSA